MFLLGVQSEYETHDNQVLIELCAHNQIEIRKVNEQKKNPVNVL